MCIHPRPMRTLHFEHWYLLIGALLVLMAIVGPRVKRLPLTTALLYLGIGLLIGWMGWFRFEPLQHTALLERLSEVAVIVSLFGAGLKLRLPLTSPMWRLPILLAFLSMTVTVALIAGLGTFWLELPLGAAILLGAVLGPTDPVLASDVQVEHASDTEPLRFTLTGEAGLNDGTAFPFVMLGLGLLGLHDLGDSFWWRWWSIDVVWAIVGGLACGTVLGMAVGRLVVLLRRQHGEAIGLDDFLALGLIALSYGAALLIHTYGFLAVFAAGLALRRIERELSPGTDAPPDVKAAAGAPEELAKNPETAPAYMTEAVLHVNEQIERIAELTLVLLCGAMLVAVPVSWSAAAFAGALFFFVRPLAVAPLALAWGTGRFQATLLSWFGIRGIGSLYYLFYALERRVDETMGETMLSITLTTVALSIVLHGVTVTPLMKYYGRRKNRSDLQVA